MKAILQAHNRKILEDSEIGNNDGCNCKSSEKCPLNGHFLTKGVIYKATVSSPPDASTSMVYFGSTKRSFKTRYNEHKSSFRGTENPSSTKLARHIYKIKRTGQEFKIDWQIVKRSKQLAPTVKFCTLCNLERKEIAQANQASLLNSRNELITTCAHSRNLFFASLKRKTPEFVVTTGSSAVT